jgi:hypothetical protein
MTSDLEIKKRTTYVAITEMQPREVTVKGKTFKFCLNNCGKIIPARNHKYCSPQCSQEWFAKHNQHGMALFVFKRENGKCQKCGHTNKPLNLIYPIRPKWNPNGYKAHREELTKYDELIGEYNRAVAEYRKTHPYRDFIADHIIPIALGGAEFDPNNVQLLCEVCNKKKTKQDQGKIARKRKLIKMVGKNTKPLSFS